MTIKQAAKILVRYPQRFRDRPGTCYGGNGDVYECSCCGRAMNWGDPHADDCELDAAVKTIGEDEDEET